MNEIARWTTPTIIYKPSTLETGDISTAVLCVKQTGKTIIEKDLSSATVNAENQTISWKLTQQETGQLADHRECCIGIDWVSNDGTRGRSKVSSYMVVRSGKDEEM